MELINQKPVALITGANQGIGLHVATELAAHGFTVLVGAREKKKEKKPLKASGKMHTPSCWM